MNAALYRVLIIAISFSLLVSCEGNGFLMDLYPIAEVVNRETHVFVGGQNQIVDARIDDDFGIRGFTARGRFSSSDEFRTFTYTEGETWTYQTTLLRVSGEHLYKIRTIDNGTWVIDYSGNYGQMWQFQDNALFSPETLAGVIVDIEDATITPEGHLWLVARQVISGGVNTTAVFRYDIVEQRTQLMHTIAGTVPFAIGFSADGQAGYLIYGDPSSFWEGVPRYIAKTVNGGQDWEEQVSTFSAMHSPRILVTGRESFLVYDGNGTSYVQSQDAGLSLFRSEIGPSFFDDIVQLPGGSLVALNYNVLSISADLGRSWESRPIVIPGGVPGQFGKLSFQDDQTGILYHWDRMFKTTDGGRTWKILLYPYDYIYE